MFRRFHVAVDGNAPTLVPNDLDIAVQSVDHGRKFGSEEENIHATELSEGVKSLRDILVQHTRCRVDHESILDIHGVALL